MIKRKNVFILIVLFSIIAIAIIAFLKSSTEYKVRFGSILWLTGEYRSYGEQFRDGAQLAMEEINEGGKKELEIIFYDSESRKEIALEKLKILKERDNINFVLEIMGSGLALNAIPYITENKMLLLSGVNTSPFFTGKGGPYFYRIIPSDGSAAQQLAKWAIDMGVTEASLIYATDIWGMGLKSVLEKSFIEMGGKLVYVKDVNVNEIFYQPIVSEIKSKRTKVTFLIMYPKDAALLLKEAGRQEVDTKFMGTDNFTGSEVIEVAGEGVDGVLFVLPTTSKNGQQNKDNFMKVYRKKYGANKNPELFTILAYDCVHLLYKTYKSASGDVEKAREYLKSVDMMGASGRIKFDSNNDVVVKDYDKKVYVYDKSSKTATAKDALSSQ